MPARSSTAAARLRALLGPDGPIARESIVALGISATTSVVAGLALGAATGRLEELPGLLLLVPAAIGLRGNIFGALGSRLGTAIHTGTFSLARRADTVVGQNVLASMVLTLVLSAAVAAMAKVVGVVFGLGSTISLAELVTISVLGGIGASLVILVITLLLSAGSVRFGWDLDIVSGPLVSAAGDVVTLPSLVLASFAVEVAGLADAVAAMTAVATVVALVVALRSSLIELRRILRESIPVLLLAGTMDLLAGITIEKRLLAFTTLPALLVLLPGFLSSAGSLGSILSSRLATRLHLGLSIPASLPDRGARAEMAGTFLLAMPMFAVTALAVQVGAWATGLDGPGLGHMVGVAMLAGLLAMAFVAAIAYYGTVLAVRLGIDPDSYGIPLVTSSLDLVGAFTLILAIVALGIA